MKKKYFVLSIPQGEWREEGAKLHLAAQSIKVGDRVMLIREGTYWEVHRLPSTRSSDALHLISENGELYRVSARESIAKILGEISSDAMWAKEGDEFREDEVKEYLKLTMGREIKLFPRSELPKGADLSLWEGSVFKIKGPCGHFH